MFRNLVFLFVALSVGRSFAQSDVVSSKAYYLCKNKKEVRTLRVEIDQDNICHSFYGKMGEEKRVGKGRNHDSCMDFINNIKKTIETSGFTCRDISRSVITYPDSE